VRAPVKLLGMARVVDGTGATVGAAHTFELSREHLWYERIRMRVACAAFSGDAPTVDALEAVMGAAGETTTTRTPGRLGGHDAVRIDGTSEIEDDGYHLPIGQWLVVDGGHAYSVRFAREMGEGTQKKFEAGLTGAPLACGGGTIFAGLAGAD
jgi:hypothetical protein